MPLPLTRRCVSQLKRELVKEWADGYVDYGHLKKVLSELVKSGKSQEFSRYRRAATPQHSRETSGQRLAFRTRTRPPVPRHRGDAPR